MAVKVRERHGAWWLFIDHRGRRKAKKIGTGERGRKLAEDVARKIEARLVLEDTGFWKDRDEGPVFADYAERYLDVYAAATLKPGTVDRYRFDLKRHLKPAFGAKRLGEITRADVKAFVSAQVNRGLSPSSVRNHVGNLSSILAHAVEDGHLEENVARGVKLPRRIDPKATIHPLTAQELSVFLDTARELHPREFPFYLCAARTGMRLGEVMALEWGAVDFHGRFIEVRKSHTRQHETTPKNGRVRRIEMTAELARVLEGHRTAMKREALAQGRPVPSRVFCGPDGKRYSQTTISDRIFHHTLERAGLRRVRFHDLRHSFASILLKAGVPLVYVQRMLGHSSIQITVDRYGHLSPEDVRGAVNVLDEVGGETGGRKGRGATIRNPSATGKKKRPEDRPFLETGVSEGTRTLNHRSHSPVLHH